MVSGTGCKFLHQNVMKRVVVLDPSLLVDETGIVLELRPVYCFREAMPKLLRRRQVNDKRQAVRSRKSVYLSHMHPSIPIGYEAGSQIPNRILCPEGHGGLKQRCLHFLTYSFSLPPAERALDCVTCIQPGQQVG